MREPTPLPPPTTRLDAPAVGQRRRQGAVEPATRAAPPSSARRTELAGPARRAARRQPDRRPATASGARGGQPRQPPDGPPRGRPAAPPVRRHGRCPGPLPVELRRLAAGLLAAIEAVGGDDLLDQVFAARRRQLGDRVREQMAERVAPDARSLDRVRELAVIQATTAISPTRRSVADGTIRLREHNCAIYNIAKGSPAACQAELDLFTEVLGADVVREQHIASGDRCCSYGSSKASAGDATGLRPRCFSGSAVGASDAQARRRPPRPLSRYPAANSRLMIRRRGVARPRGRRRPRRRSSRRSEAPSGRVRRSWRRLVAAERPVIATERPRTVRPGRGADAVPWRCAGRDGHEGRSRRRRTAPVRSIWKVGVAR